MRALTQQGKFSWFSAAGLLDTNAEFSTTDYSDARGPAIDIRTNAGTSTADLTTSTWT